MADLPEAQLETQQAAQIIGVSTATLRRMEDRGKISSTRTAGGHRRYKLSDLEQLKKAHPSEIERNRSGDEPIDIDKLDGMIDMEEAGRLLGVSRTTLRRWEKEGSIISSKMVGRRFYHRETVESLLSAGA